MATFLNRPIGDLLVRGRMALGMTQHDFGEALGASLRTAQRWDAGRSVPTVANVRTLAALVFPKDPVLATELASAASETLVSLGLVSPPAPVQPSTPSIPRAVLIDSVVSATAEATKTYPSAARAGLLAAFTQARALGVPLDELERALAAPVS